MLNKTYDNNFIFCPAHREKSFTQKFEEYKYIDFMYYYNMRI